MTAAALGLLAALVLLLSPSGGETTGGAQQANGKGGSPKQGNGQLAEIARECSANMGEDGVGKIDVDRRLIISNEEGEIGVPCKITLKKGGQLVLNHVKLRSKDLAVMDETTVLPDSDAIATNGGTSVRFDNSELRATGEHGLWVQLYDAEDAISMHNTDLDYPANVWARVSGVSDENPGGGRIDLTNTRVRSLEAGSEQVNVQFVAGEQGRRAKFNKATFDTAEPDGESQDVLLFAGDCQRAQVEGGPKECDPAGLAGLQAEQGDPIVVDGEPYVPPEE